MFVSSDPIQVQEAQHVWPHNLNKLKIQTTQTNIVNSSLLTLELWGRGEEGRVPIHRIVCLDVAVPDLMRLFCCCCCSTQRWWGWASDYFWVSVSGTRRIGSDLLFSASAPLALFYLPSERARCLPCTETRSIATIVTTLWRCNEEDYPGPADYFIMSRARDRLLLPYYRNIWIITPRIRQYEASFT